MLRKRTWELCEFFTKHMAYNFSPYHFTPDHKIHQSHIAPFVLILATCLIREDFLAFGLFMDSFTNITTLRFQDFLNSASHLLPLFMFFPLPAAALFSQEQQVSERAMFSSREHY